MDCVCFQEEVLGDYLELVCLGIAAEGYKCHVNLGVIVKHPFHLKLLCSVANLSEAYRVDDTWEKRGVQ
jgi:hypothetical protein